MSDSTSEVKNASQEMAAGNQTILSEVSVLQENSAKINQSVQEMDSSARQVNDTKNTLSSLSSQMTSAIAEIGHEIDQFKV